MILHRLTQKRAKLLAGRELCCVGRSNAYLTEFCDKYDILGRISFIVDTNPRNLGRFIFREKEIPVFELSYLLQVDLTDMAIVITGDYPAEAFDEITALLGGKFPSMEVLYFMIRETEYEDFYRKKYLDEPLKNLLLFRSGPHASSYVKGMDFADNARALFEYALQIGLNRQYELVWLVKNPREFERYDQMENVRFLSFDWSVSDRQEERDAYYHALCLAKYIFFTDAYGFARNCRSDQVRIQLWHGCGFKTRVNFVRCEKRYEYMTVISDLYADIHADIYGLRENQVLVTGYAKQDWLFHADQDDLKKLGIPGADKYIFWLPTFRSTGNRMEQLDEYCLGSETGLPVIDTKDKMNCLNVFLSEKRIVLIVKLHPFQDKATVHCGNYSNIHLVESEDLAVQDIPVNRLLGQADALISDYSSAAVDFMLLDRPIAFMLEDMEEYKRSRRFVFEDIRKWLPGKEIFTFEDVLAFVGEIADHCDATAVKRRSLRDKMHKYCDDNNCQRILKALRICH